MDWILGRCPGSALFFSGGFLFLQVQRNWKKKKQWIWTTMRLDNWGRLNAAPFAFNSLCWLIWSKSREHCYRCTTCGWTLYWHSEHWAVVSFCINNCPLHTETSVVKLGAEWIYGYRGRNGEGRFDYVRFAE